MIGEHLPQHRQQRLVGDNAFPRRLQPADASVFQLGGEHLPQHKLPRIELEQIANHLILQIGKLAFFAQADIFNVEEFRRLGGAVLQILHGAAIFNGIAAAGHMQQLKAKLLAQLAEAIDQLFLQTVELVAARRQLAGVELIFQPDPLEECRFIEGGWRIGVVF